MMVEALARQPGPVDCQVFEGKDHFTINRDMADPANLWVRTLRARIAAG